MDEFDHASLLRDALLVQEVGSALRHSLRNRIAAVRNASFFLERRVRNGAPTLFDSDPRLRSMFELIESEVKATEALLAAEPRVERLLDDARGECDATRVARSVVDALAHSHDVSVSLTLPDALDVRASEALLFIALECVVTNAIRTALEAGGEVRVSATRDANGWIALHVTDDGRGTDDPDPYDASRPLESTPDSRFGVGLARARRAALVWSGHLDLVGIEPHGTRATLWIPSLDTPADALLPP